MTQAYPCLVSLGKLPSKYRHFPFTENEVTIGRSNEVTYTILSPMISRCHAIIQKREDGSWTITDNKSLNGVAVNNKRLEASSPHTLTEGDVVQLGVPPSPDLPAEYVYRFFASLKVRKERKQSTKRHRSEDGGMPSKHFKQKQTDIDISRVADRNSEAVDEHAGKEEDENEDAKEPLKAAYEEKLQMLARQLQEKEEEKSRIVQQLEQERQQRQVIEELQKQQEEKVSEMDAKQRQLMQEAAAAEKQMRQQLEERLREREEALRTQMQQQLASLATEKQQVEERLQREMEKAVQEKDQEMQDQLEKEKQRLQKIIESKELEQKALESQLVESRVENERAKADTLTTREAILSEFAETMETELQCVICNELFIRPISLGCAHAFCALCIRQWLAVKKECPTCRTPVTSQLRSFVLENYIDRMVQQLSAALKQRRTELVAQRHEAERQLDEEEKRKAANAAALLGRGGGRRRGQAQGGRATARGRARGAAAAPPATRAPAPAARVPAPRAIAPRVTISQATVSLPTVPWVFAPLATAPRMVAPASAAPRMVAPASTALRPAAPPAATQPSTQPAQQNATASVPSLSNFSLRTSIAAIGTALGFSAAPQQSNNNSSATPESSAVVTVDTVDGATVNQDTAAVDPILVSDAESEVITDSDDSEHYYSYDRYRGIDSEEDSNSNSDDDDGDYVRGRGYYGGYGRCFRCGMRGHWANGCPLL